MLWKPVAEITPIQIPLILLALEPCREFGDALENPAQRGEHGEKSHERQPAAGDSEPAEKLRVESIRGLEGEPHMHEA